MFSDDILVVGLSWVVNNFIELCDDVFLKLNATKTEDFIDVRTKSYSHILAVLGDRLIALCPKLVFLFVCLFSK